MTPRQFEEMLDRYGPDPDCWPAALRARAERLLARSADARAVRDRILRLASLAELIETPPAPSIASIVARATARPQAGAPAVARPAGRRWWLGLSRWHAAAFACCLLIGIAAGLASAPRSELPDSVYNLIDGSFAGEGL